MARPKNIPGPLIGENNDEPASALDVVPEITAKPTGFVPLIPNVTGEKEIELLRFKTDVGIFRRNIAWKRGAVDIQEIEHRHFWDSLSLRGEPNTHCVARNGHTHSMNYELSPDGKGIRVNCGPALREVQRRSPDGQAKRAFEPILLHMADDAVNGGYKPVHDSHNHVVTYMTTEKLLVRAD